MVIADFFLWPMVCLTAVNSAQAFDRTPRKPQQILPAGLEIGLGVQPTSSQRQPLVQLSTRPNAGAAGQRMDQCRSQIADAGTIGLNFAFPELTVAISANLSFDKDSSAVDMVCEYDPDMDATTPQIIRRHNYLAQSHWVITKDGYILELHRIPKVGAPPVLVQHGLLFSSATWILNGPKQSLPYLLSDAGYDVWMGNYRGNVYSRRHIILNPDDPEFWNFSVDELGLYDLPAEIDYILRLTRNDQLNYIGHSMGCSGFFIMMHMRPEYNKKIRQMHALAPVLYGQGLRTPLRKLFPLLRNYPENSEVLPNSDFIRAFGRQYCRQSSPSNILCSNVLFLIIGYDSKQLNETKLPLYLSHAPAGTSLKAFIHLTQAANSGRYRAYNYDRQKNLEVYGDVEPPEYDLSKTTCPVYVHYGRNDWLNHPVNMLRLGRQLSNCRGVFKVPFAKFNHLDFLWAMDAKSLLYDLILEQMEYE